MGLRALPQACCRALIARQPQRCAANRPPVFLQTMLTAISMSAIATNGVVPGKGCWRPGLRNEAFLLGVTERSPAVDSGMLHFHFGDDLDISFTQVATGEAGSGPCPRRPSVDVPLPTWRLLPVLRV